MRIRVLGASGGEFPGFNPPAFLIDDGLLLDAGTIGAVLDEDAQWKIRDILVTHAHLDHIRGIPFLADNIIVKNKKHGITVHGLSQTLGSLKRNLLNGSIWPDFTRIPTTERPVLRLSRVRSGRLFMINSYTVTPYAVSHTVPAAGYAVHDAEGRCLIYTGDTGPTDGIWREHDCPVHCLIVEVSFPNRLAGMAVETGHLTAGLLKREIAKMPHKPGRVLVTHPKPQYLKTIKKEIAALGLRNVRILKSGDKFTI